MDELTVLTADVRHVSREMVRELDSWKTVFSI